MNQSGTSFTYVVSVKKGFVIKISIKKHNKSMVYAAVVADVSVLHAVLITNASPNNEIPKNTNNANITTKGVSVKSSNCKA